MLVWEDWSSGCGCQKRSFRLLSFPIVPPAAEEGVLVVEELLLGRGKLVVGIDLVLVGCVTFENHEFFVEEDEVGAFVEGGKDGEGFGEFEGEAAGLWVAFGGGLAEFDEAEDFLGKSIANAGDGTGGPAVDEAVEDLGIDSGHEDDGFIDAGDVFSGVAEGCGTAKFLEANEGGEFLAEREEEICFGFEAVVGRIVNDGRKLAAGF